ncbi:hypothetical protein CEXT_465401 [Caerostris extrusa]|uniref:Uncharacterized protein n=1 Tax=Caerostris extrusa TaxID=172846 RepID=A0AAV4TTG6_CAEEX|nr:hypothetical protein CEXT_465401 [Caerostris extrusa]
MPMIPNIKLLVIGMILQTVKAIPCWEITIIFCKRDAFPLFADIIDKLENNSTACSAIIAADEVTAMKELSAPKHTFKIRSL